MLGAGALGGPRGMVWGGRREESSGWGTRVCLWQIHFDIWQNQYNIVKFKNKIKKKINFLLSRVDVFLWLTWPTGKHVLNISQRKTILTTSHDTLSTYIRKILFKK